jgi:hypothetical protein
MVSVENGETMVHHIIERKPDNGIEVQNVADVTTGIMLQLKLVKSAKNESRIDQEQFDEDELQLGKGTRVCLELLKNFFNTGRLVTGDSYFASVEAATILSAKGLKFIGNVKTCSSGFPKKYFDELHMYERGDRSVLVLSSKGSPITRSFTPTTLAALISLFLITW